MHPRKHVLLVTFPAYGHVIPLLELGRKISQFHDVTLAVSAEFVDQMIQRELVSTDGPLNLYRIPDGYSLKLALDISDPKGLHQMMLLVVPGIRTLADGLPKLDANQLLRNELARPVDVVIVDSFMTADVAACLEKGIPLYHFVAAGAGYTLVFLEIDENWPTCKDGDSFGMLDEPKPGAPPTPLPEGFKAKTIAVNKVLVKAQGIIVNGVEELEKDVVSVLRNHPNLPKTPIYTVGPLMSKDKQSSTQFAQTQQILNWMDRKNKESVVYVSFGSVAWPAGKQITELAKALHESKKPFIFSLRQTYHGYLPDDVRSKIPDQFTNSDSQFLIVDWAPQKEILAHLSTSLFISHCGWNSALESLAAGVPILAWPMFADQKINGRFLEKRGVAYLLEETGMHSKKVLQADEIMAAVEKVVGTGAECRAKAKEWKQVIQQAQEVGGSSFQNLKVLAEFVKH